MSRKSESGVGENRRGRVDGFHIKFNNNNWVTVQRS